VKADVAERLIALNRKFYTDFGEPFSATRGRLQPGVRRVLETLVGDETVLDLGCGNGELARALAGRGHRGAYLGVDASRPLLADAADLPEGFPATFLEADLTSDWRGVIARSHGVATKQSQTKSEGEIAALPEPALSENEAIARNDTFDVICSFATLHHIPSREIQLNFLRMAHDSLAPGGRFVHSNWQFLNSPRLQERVQPWEAVGLAETDVEPGDYLLDWRAGGMGLRYVHHFAEGELVELAHSSGFRVVDTFYSDGKEGNLAIYQEWRPG
jgi:SAM-dependent methyltransferase